MSRPQTSFRDGSIEAALANGAGLLDSTPAAAALQAREVLRNHPRNTAAHRLFARAMARLGHADQARLARARAVQFSRDVPVLVRAHQATRQGRSHEVEAMLAEHLDRYPDDPVALTVSGDALARIGRFAEAVTRFERALAFMPEYGEAGAALVRVNQQRFDIPAALAALEALIARRPDDLALLRWKASLLSNLQENGAAVEILTGLTERHPDMPELWISLGDELRTLGDGEGAYDAYRRAAEIAPNLGRPWWGLAALRFAAFGPGDRAKMQAALAAASAPDERYHLHFALATAFEQAGSHREAFEQFAAGNAVRHQQDPFDPAIVEHEVELSRRHLSRQFFAARAGTGAKSAEPIFIVGMPRSGSTLIEQVLAGHPEIEGTAELPLIPVLVRMTAAEHGLAPGTSYRALLPELDPAVFAAIGEEYLRLAAGHRKSGKPYFLDKLPHNWADIGFIKLILPNARIIDVRRSPMDCCWSNFRLLFAKGHPSSNSLEGMAAYYRHYLAMMAHFDKALPGAVHRVIYERLVDDFELEVRRLLDLLELPFDPDCLEFHTRSRPVATASAEQVRRPLNREGIGAWRRYAAWLGPLENAVGDLESTYAD